MKLPRREFFALLSTLVLCVVTTLTANAASSIAGTYTGSYHGTDYGALTIVIDNSDNVTCDFFSTPLQTHYVLPGVVNSDSTAAIGCADFGTNYFFNANGDNTTYAGNTISGTWTNSVNNVAGSGTFITQFASNVTVLSSAFSPAALTGAWYDPTFSGSGFTIVMSGAGFVATYYGWDANGNRLWLTSNVGPTTLTAGTPLSLTMSNTTSGTFTVPGRTAATWGTLSLNFTSCTQATATLTGTDGTLNFNLQQLVAGVGLPKC